MMAAKYKDMNFYLSALNLDITPGGFSPTVTSTAVTAKAREELMEQYHLGLYNQSDANIQMSDIAQANISQDDMGKFLDKFLAKNLKMNSNENNPHKEYGEIEASQGEFSKLTLIDLDATSDKLIDSDELPQEFLQPAFGGDNNYECPFETKMSEAVPPYSFESYQEDNKDQSQFHENELLDEHPLSMAGEIHGWKLSFEETNCVVDEFDDGEFHDIDYDQLDQEEDDCVKRNERSVEESFANKVNLDCVSFSGYQQENQVTLKPSWITSPVRRFLKPGNKIDVDDLLKARSCKLGALDNIFEEKPSFGMDASFVSPPHKECCNDEPFVEEIENCSILQTFDSEEDIPDVELTAVEFVSQVQKNEVDEPCSIPPPAYAPNDSHLEETINNLKGQLTSEDMMKLCVMASKSNEPHAMLEKIMQIAHQQMANTCNSLDDETSLDILEIRKQKEAIKLQRGLLRAESGKQNEIGSRKPTSKYDIKYESSQSDKDSSSLILNKIPTKVFPVEQCIIGIGAKVHVDVVNPFNSVLHIKLKRMSETLNGQMLSYPVLSFKADYYIQPQSRSTIMFHLCSRTAGQFRGMLEMSVEDTGSAHNSRILQVSADVEVPLIDVVCENSSDLIDFGVLPESCCQKKIINIINKSKIMFPVTMSVTKCSWGSERSSNFHSISTNVLSCELPSDETVMFSTLQFRAHRLVGSSLEEVDDTLRIMMDRPLFAPLIIKEIPIKTIIGKVSLRTKISVSPLEIRGIAGELTVAEMPLLNGSDFPLTLKFSISSDIFIPSVTIIAIEPKKEYVTKIVFQPDWNTPAVVKCTLVIVVEPDGLNLEIPLVGLTQSPRPKIPLSVPESEPAKIISKNFALECNRTSFLFGSVGIGESSTQTLKIINRWTDESRDLTLGVIGSNAFKIYSSDSPEPAQFIRINASDKGILNVVFSPEDRNPHSATIVLKPKGANENMKFQLPAQGFGGKGKLVFKDWQHNSVINLGNVIAGVSVNASTVAFNNGTRSIFVKLYIESEEKTAVECKTNIEIRPKTFRLKPQESIKLSLIMILPKSYCSGKFDFGSLKVIYGDDILLRRFQRLKNRKFAKRKVSDVDLDIIQTDWSAIFCTDDINETDSFASRPEDVLVFFKSCTKLSMRLEATIEESDYMCSTLHPVLFQEDSMMFPEDRQNTVIPGLPEREFDSKSETFKVFPPIVDLSLNHLSEEVCVVSLLGQDTYIEVKSYQPWLDIQPRETIIPKFGFVMLSVTIIREKASGLAGSASFQIFSENSVQTVKVIISSVGTSQVVHEVQPSRKLPTLPSNSSQAKPFHSSNSSYRNQSNKQKTSSSINSEVEIPSSLSFPNTKVNSESALKLLIKNTSSTYQQIKANIDSGSFHLKHKEFPVKPCTGVSVPIFFRPQYKKKHQSVLSVNIVGENRTVPVQLHGNAV